MNGQSTIGQAAAPGAAPTALAGGAPARWRAALGWAGGAFLGAVLLVAALAKAIDPAAFARQIEAEGLAGLLPATAVVFLALALEAALGLALLLNLRRLPVLTAAAALVAFFLFLTGRAWLRWLQGDLSAAEGCGCFGSLVERTPAEAFWQDALLMVPALALAFVGRRGVARRPRGRLVAVAAGTLAVVALTAAAPRLPLDALVTGVGPGSRVEAICAGGGDDRVCLADVAPQLLEGEHWLVLVGLDGSTDWVAPLNEIEWDPETPAVVALTGDPPERVHELQWTAGPAFRVQEAPEPLVRSMVRTLPRSLLVRDGSVITTNNGLPPATERATAGEESR